jgi:hypothetical protein
MDGHHMFSIYGTLFIVIKHKSHIKIQLGIRAELGLTPSQEGPGKLKENGNVGE